MVRSFKTILTAITLSIGLIAMPICAQDADWKPKQAPLMTEWAAEVSPTNAHPEYPRPQMGREAWMSLNGLWQFAPAQENETPPIGEDLHEQILVPFPVESALSGIMRHEDRMWYRRTFEVPADWDGQKILLHFGAVDWETTVYVNGQEVGTHRGGYDGFTFDVTDFLSASGEQEIVVGVYDPTDAGGQPRGKQVLNPSGIFYSPNSGIWQTVWLEPVSPDHITGLELTPDIDAQVLKAKVLGEAADGATVQLTASNNGETVGTVEGKLGEELQLPVPDPKLWSPDDPFLYDLSVKLLVDGQVVDEVGSYFGMRSIALKKIGNFMRIVLNGKPIFQMGPLDQGYWPDGIYTAPTDNALRYDIEMAKKLGFNMIRKHVKVEPDRWYYWADKLGVLVWQDMPSATDNVSDEVRTQFEAELTQLINSRRNHPSIVMWVIFNEAWGQYFTPKLVDMVRALDLSRLIDGASGWTDVGAGDVADVHVYVGPGAMPANGKRASVLGEYGGLGLRIPDHLWGAGDYAYEWTDSPEALTARYLELLGKIPEFIESRGVSAAVYTELTDIENEVNGLMTYDRKVVKVTSVETLADAHKALIDSVANLEAAS